MEYNRREYSVSFGWKCVFKGKSTSTTIWEFSDKFQKHDATKKQSVLLGYKLLITSYHSSKYMGPYYSSSNTNTILKKSWITVVS